MAVLRRVSQLGPIKKKKLGHVKDIKQMKVLKARIKVRAPWQRQAAKMTAEQWKTLQKGMDAKFPVPKYMDGGHEKGRSHTLYREETYMEITRWTSETKIRYRPHAKAPGSKSHTRYEKYSKARTVKEALNLGSWPADWCWDYERGFIKVVGGRRRDEPIDSSETDLKGLDEVDRILARWFIREAARMLGISMKAIKEDADAKDELLLRMKRTVAENKATDILSERASSRRKLSHEDVLSVLRHWGFRKNVTRINVTPDGHSFVFSDTMGLVSDRTGGINPTKYTLAYPNVSKVLCDFMRDHLPDGIPSFTFTSINVNKNYAGRRHRDASNVGPSIIAALGEFKGGRLCYFPNDDKSLDLENLPKSDMVTLDLRKRMALFDGRRAHQVEPFSGERYSLVWFTCPRNDRADAKALAAMQLCGFNVPTKKQTATALALLKPPNGYSSGAKSTPEGKHRTWSLTE